MITRRGSLISENRKNLNKGGVKMVQQRFMSVDETAVYLGLSSSAIRKWIRTGQIPFNRMNGSIRFDIERINSWAQRS